MGDGREKSLLSGLRDGVFSVAAIALKSDLNSTVLDYAIFSSSHF
jgi:hypothetical protein